MSVHLTMLSMSLTHNILGWNEWITVNNKIME